ncbi:MAG: chorismate mutase [Solirubrobacteraceae bacterium]
MSDLAPFRARLDDLDDQITRLLGERFDICREVAHHKRANGVPMLQPDRVAEVRARYISRGSEVNLPRDFTEELFDLLIGATCKLEDDLIAGPAIVRDESQ